MNSAHEIVPCQDCGEQTIAARPVCNLCEADKGLFQSPPEPEPAASATATAAGVRGADAMSDDDLWHLAGVVAGLAGASLLSVSQADCVSAIRAEFMNPGAGRAYLAEQARMRARVPMPPMLDETLLSVGSAAHRAALNDMTGSDGYVVRKIYEALYSKLAAQYGTVQAISGPESGETPRAPLVLMPQVLDDDLWRAGIGGFRTALTARPGQDRYVVAQTYKALHAHLLNLVKGIGHAA